MDNSLFFSGDQTQAARYFNAQILNYAEKVYSSEGRYYHNFDHISEMIWVGKRTFQLTYKQYIAIIFHDIVYDPKSNINEELSAKQVFDVIQSFRGGMDYEELRYFGDVAAIIRDTKSHYYPTTPESAVVLDLDLERLARPLADVENYGKLIRMEYAHIDDKTFNQGRKEFFQNFLNIEHPFSTPYGRQFWEPKAIENVNALLSKM